MPGHIRRTSSEKRLPRKPAPVVHDGYGTVQVDRRTSMQANYGGGQKGKEQSLFGLARSDTPFSDTDTELPKYSLPSPTQGYGWTSEKTKEKM